LGGLLDVYEEAFGHTPADLMQRSHVLSDGDTWNLLSAHDSLGHQQVLPIGGRSELWPLISHHRPTGRALIADSQNRQILPRALTLLLAHDGLVVADPLDDVQRLIADGGGDQALTLCRRSGLRRAVRCNLQNSNFVLNEDSHHETTKEAESHE
jgi:hypothetical protein